jgi:hypothetical protein
VQEGEVAVGDAIEVEPTSLPAIALVTLVRGSLGVDELRQVAADERVPAGWRKGAERALARVTNVDGIDS